MRPTDVLGLLAYLALLGVIGGVMIAWSLGVEVTPPW